MLITPGNLKTEGKVVNAFEEKPIIWCRYIDGISFFLFGNIVKNSLLKNFSIN